MQAPTFCQSLSHLHHKSTIYYDFREYAVFIYYDRIQKLIFNATFWDGGDLNISPSRDIILQSVEG
jgi:hypothetical protein